MNAINLIPVAERRGSSLGGRSGGGVYVLLGALAALVILGTTWGIGTRAIAQKRNEIATVRAQAERAETVSVGLQEYTKFATLREQRTQVVTQLVDGRFNWSRTVREVARTLPAGSWVTGFNGTTPGATGTAGAAASPSATGPSVQLSGCAPSQNGVAGVMVALRRIEGLQRVALASAAKGTGTAGSTTAPSTSSSTSSAGSAGGCGVGRSQFALTLYFAGPSPAATPAAGAANGQAAAPTGATK